MSPTREQRILRDLAHRVAELAALPEQAERVRLWTACNDLRPARPMVFIDPQNGWRELDAAWLTLECEDPWHRGVEHGLRRRILRHEQLPDDFPLLPHWEVPVRYTGAGYDDYGVPLVTTPSGQPLGAYHIEPVIRSEADFGMLHPRPIRIDHAATERDAARAHELFGDILSVRRVGRAHWRYGLTRVLIHMRGLDQMMLDLYDHPALMHRLMAFLRDDFLAELDLFEREGAIGLNHAADHVTGSGGLSPTNHLPQADFAGVPRLKDCLCWAESQETVGVSPAQFDEFVLAYQLPLIQRFGLVDYGCCEPLDTRLELLIRRIPNLRWVSVSPWADRARCAELLGDRYVYVYKPNPARVCCPTPDWHGAERELRETLDLARGCPVHLVLKDTHTFCNEPERATHWCRMAAEVAGSA